MIDQRILDIKLVEVVKGFKARFLHTESMTFAFWEVEAGYELPLHHHQHEQVSQIVEGEFEMTIGDSKKIHKPGSILVIPSDVPHSGKSLTPCKILDVFCPVREDYKSLL